MAAWQDYRILYPGDDHAVTGTLKVLVDVHSPQLDNDRDILVYLPPSYDQGEARYPVLYMHDGQNLFDAATSLVGEWQVDETLEALSQQGIEAIAVGIPNMPDRRLDEYSPYRNDLLGMGGQGDAYLAFIIETVKPLINRDFRTQTDRAHTGIMGSSMGGLISLVAYCRYADVFGFAGIMSPAFWFAKDAIFAEVAATLPPPGRLYLDVGTREIADPTDRDHRIGAISERYLGDAQAMRDLLVEKGYHAGRDVVYVEEQDAPHHEIAWARRLPDALRFLLAGRT